MANTQQIKNMIIQEAQRQGVNVNLALAIAQHESGFNPNAHNKANRDGTSDRGVFQLNSRYFKLKNPFDPKENIQRGIAHIKALQKSYGNDINKILAAYNAGSGAVNSGRIPSSTKNQYIPKARAIYDRLVKETGGSNTPQVSSDTNNTGVNNTDMSSNTNVGTTFDLAQLFSALQINPVQITDEQLQAIRSQIQDATNLTQVEKEKVLADLGNTKDELLANMETQLKVANMQSMAAPVLDQEGKPVLNADGSVQTEMVSPVEYQRRAQAKGQKQSADITNRFRDTDLANTRSSVATEGSVLNQRLRNAYNDAIQRNTQAVDRLRQQYLAGGYEPNSDYIVGLGERMGSVMPVGVPPSMWAPMMNAARASGQALENQNLLRYRRNIERNLGMPYEQAMQVMQAEQQAIQNATTPYLEGVGDLTNQTMQQYGALSKEGLSNLADLYDRQQQNIGYNVQQASDMARTQVSALNDAYNNYISNLRQLAGINADAATAYDTLMQQGRLQEADALLRGALTNANMSNAAAIQNAQTGSQLTRAGMNAMLQDEINKRNIQQRQAEQAQDMYLRQQGLDIARDNARAANIQRATTSAFYGGGAASPLGQAIIRYADPSLGDAMYGAGNGAIIPQAVNPQSGMVPQAQASGMTPFALWRNEVNNQGLGQ